MHRQAVHLGLIGAMAIGSAGPPALADTASQDQVEALKARIQALEARLEQQDQDGESWLHEARGEEVRAIVREAMEDARTRSAMLEDGMVAGHDGRNFVLKGGGNEMRFTGQIQGRNVVNRRRDDPGAAPSSAKSVRGAELRRVKFGIRGHMDLGKKIDYRIVFATNRDTGGVFLEDAFIGTDLADWLHAYAGRLKAPFAKEELVSSGRQTAVDRSAMVNNFTAGRTEGFGFRIDPPGQDLARFNVMFNDGWRQGDAGASKRFDRTPVDFAVTGRGEFNILGNRWNYGHYGSRPGDETGLFAGAAIHYQADKTGTAAPNNQLLLWTADAAFKHDGLSLAGAVIGSHQFNDGFDDWNDYGLMALASYNFMLSDHDVEPFVRFDWTNFGNHRDRSSFRSMAAPGDRPLESHEQFLTLGLNYFLSGHNAKFTVDWTYAFNPVNAGSGSGMGHRATTRDGMWLLRSQFQLLF